ncbi:MAG TPA: FliM/FliN family flagellar motor switch protein [Vicinamibacterales bacterium]|nr:FliM/FliN family flagellar motor switch protein [Vicinamibacterales bacterium]
MSLPAEKPQAPPVADASMALLAPMHDIECAVDFIIGTGRLKVRDCLRLERQSIVALEQSGGADLELRVHGVPLAVGEVVIMDDVTALRLTRITTPAGMDL